MNVIYSLSCYGFEWEDIEIFLTLENAVERLTEIKETMTKKSFNNRGYKISELCLVGTRYVPSYKFYEFNNDGQLVILNLDEMETN